MLRLMVLFAAVLVLAAGPAMAVVGGGEVVLKNKGGDVTFSHEVHMTGGSLSCQSCHPKLFLNAKKHKAVSMKQMEKGQSCGACHNGKAAFSVKSDCNSCHK